MQIRGLKDIATHGATVNRCVPRTGAQAAFQLGLLEQEKSKLQREIGTWLANRERAETRLRMLQERRKLLKNVIDADAASEPHLSGTPAVARKRRPKPRGHTVTLQY